MARRPKLTDVARKAGVGVATVDRVLNARANVRPETALAVLEAARAVGYHGTPLIRRRLDEAALPFRFGFLLQRAEQPFYQAFEKALRDACELEASARVVPEIGFLTSQEPTEIVPALRAMAARNQAVALVAIEHPTVAAAIAELEQHGTPVFTLLSDIAPNVRHGYFGTDNRKVGRTAGWLLARCVSSTAKVALFVGSHRFHGHEEREIGFRAYLREHAPGVAVVETQASLEDRAVAREAVRDLLARHPDLAGLYVAGGGIEGAVDTLREEREPEAVAVVGNEVTHFNRVALAEGYLAAVIDTPREMLSRELLRAMLGALRHRGVRPGQVYLPFGIYVAENI
ncbi:MAG: LacI family DNA-binding transcriptional regulator [Devosia sp.]